MQLFSVMSSRSNGPLSPFTKVQMRQGEGKNSVCGEEMHKQVKFVKGLLTSPMLAILLNLSPPIYNPPVSFAQTPNVERGATLFSRACIGCHDMGGNIIQPGATLFTNDLQRNGVDNEEEIYRITYYGKGRMPGFGENCMPRGQCTFGPRLQEEEIKLLAEYVKLQADQGWPKVENNTD